MKYLFNVIDAKKIDADVIESLAQNIFVGEAGKQVINDVLGTISASPHDNNINDTRFVALIERIFDVTSSQEIPFDYSVTVALYCILEKERLLFVENGKYCEAGQVQKQLTKLYDFEVSQRQTALHLNQTRDLMNIKKAHDDQYLAFIKEWDSFENDFENRSDIATKSMRDRQDSSLEEYLRKLEIEARGKPHLFSKELKEWRKKQQILAYQENYSEAQKVKVISDAIEEEETMNINANCDSTALIKAANFRQQQEAEVKALSKRIDSQREAHKLKRGIDCKRLYQRNQNIQAALKSKQTIEGQKQLASIEKDVQNKIAKLKQR